MVGVSASKAADLANALRLAEKLSPYEFYAGIVVEVVIIAELAIWFFRRSKGKQ